MKFLKIAGLTLLVTIILLAIVSLFLPSKIHVERTTEITVPAKVVFDQVNTLKNWKNWSHWDKVDPNMKSEYEGPESGAGAMHSWSSTHRSVGNGSLTIVESTEPTHIITSLSFEGSDVSLGGWHFVEADGITMVTLYMNLEFGFIGRLFPGLMMNEWLGEDFEKALAGLKEYCESLPPVDENNWNVETINTDEMQVMSISVTTPMNEFTTKLGETYGRIMDAIVKQDIRQVGPIYAIYYKWSADTVEMEPGIPVDNPGKDVGDIKASLLPSVKAMKVDYYGNYPGTEQAHYFMDEWAKQNNVTIIGAPWEEYVTDPTMEPDTSKWLTRIYYPIE